MLLVIKKLGFIELNWVVLKHLRFYQTLSLMRKFKCKTEDKIKQKLIVEKSSVPGMSYMCLSHLRLLMLDIS